MNEQYKKYQHTDFVKIFRTISSINSCNFPFITANSQTTAHASIQPDFCINIERFWCVKTTVKISENFTVKLVENHIHFTLFDYVHSSSLNINKHGYLFTFSGAYCQAVVKE